MCEGWIEKKKNTQDNVYYKAACGDRGIVECWLCIQYINVPIYRHTKASHIRTIYDGFCAAYAVYGYMGYNLSVCLSVCMYEWRNVWKINKMFSFNLSDFIVNLILNGKFSNKISKVVKNF